MLLGKVGIVANTSDGVAPSLKPRISIRLGLLIERGCSGVYGAFRISSNLSRFRWLGLSSLIVPKEVHMRLERSCCALTALFGGGCIITGLLT